MVGRGVLLECLDSHLVEAVLVINRQTVGIQHPKLKEVLHQDYFNWDGMEEEFGGYDACFFCLGVSAFGMSETDYSKITYDLTLGLAKFLATLNPELTFCYVSGTGTDSTEQGRTMWARIKGKTENALLKLPFKAVYLFRPGFIQPLKGIKSKTKLYNSIYMVFKPLYPALKFLFPTFVTNTTLVGKAMINAAVFGHVDKYLKNKDINQLASS